MGSAKKFEGEIKLEAVTDPFTATCSLTWLVREGQ